MSELANLLSIARRVATSEPLTPEQCELVREQFGGDQYQLSAAIIQALTTIELPPQQARAAWEGILVHKFDMTRALCREVDVSVAALDYLSNLTRPENLPAGLPPSVQQALLRESGGRDELTGMLDRIAFHGRLSAEIRRWRRYRDPVSVLLLGVDELDSANRKLGRPSGDGLLCTLAKRLTQAIRDTDSASRYEGDEFAVVLPRTWTEEALGLSERIQIELAADWSTAPSVYVGVGCCPEHGRTAEEIMTRAAAALSERRRSA